MSDQKIKVGITAGDPNGIGYEVILKALTDPRMCELCTPVVYGSAKATAFYKNKNEELQGFSFNPVKSPREAHPKRVNLIDCSNDVEIKVEPGVRTPEAGAVSIAALTAAAADLKAGLLDVVVTAPICKENVQQGEFHFTGHTEFFADRFGGEPLMMMVSELLKVGLMTIHIPVAEVSASITSEKIVAKLHELRQTLIKDFGIHEPRIAVLGLNPHAGDGGLIGKEEIEIITPAIQQANREKVLAFGPFAADGFFAATSYTKYDAILAMYHDQGLAPFKALSADGVNFTAGLRVIRTSPAHGVGFDIAGEEKAEAGSMRAAIYLALDIYRNRVNHVRISANPLKSFKRETGKDVSVLELEQEKD